MAAVESYSQKTPLMSVSITIRRMLEGDLTAVSLLEREAYPYPWSEGSFRDSLLSSDECWVMESDGHLIGHGILTTVLDDATVLNIAIDPRSQKRGLGARMLTYLLTVAREKGAKNCFLEVRPSNVNALSLYRRAGFVEVGRRPNYYPVDGGREDALVLQRVWE